MAKNKKKDKQQHQQQHQQKLAVPTAPFRRVFISGVIKLKTELHIGASAHQSTGVNEVETDAVGNPYLPSSSVRGVLAAMLDSEENTKLYQRLFGMSRQKSEDDAVAGEIQGGSGRLRVLDAQLCDGFSFTNEEKKLDERSRTSIDPVTGAAKQHHLTTLALVPVGTCFDLTVMLEHAGLAEKGISNQEVETLLALLDGLNSQSLGTGKSIGQGQVAWGSAKVKAISEDGYRKWLVHNLQHKAAAPSNVSIKPLSEVYGDLNDIHANGLVSTGHWLKQCFQLQSLSPILINDPVEVERRRKELESKPTGAQKVNTPDHTFLKHEIGGKEIAVIPGSTLKGWFRAQARRILLTLTQGEGATTIDGLLRQMFGGTEEGASLLRFSDAVVELKEGDVHEQTFIAVDRFTGGVKEGALFSAESLWTDQAIVGKIEINESRLEGWMRLLLLFVWSDAKEGDLVLGWGKGKGYGRLTLDAVAGGVSWLDTQDTRECEAWNDELQRKLPVAKQGVAA